MRYFDIQVYVNRFSEGRMKKENNTRIVPRPTFSGMDLPWPRVATLGRKLSLSCTHCREALSKDGEYRFVDVVV
jgi:hypothetical protein